LVIGVALIPLVFLIVGRLARLRQREAGNLRLPADLVARTSQRYQAEAVVPLAMIGAGIGGLATAVFGILPVAVGIVGGFTVTAFLAGRVFAASRE